MYHKMQKEESNHLKIDIKEDEIDKVSPEQMFMGMTGATSLPTSQSLPMQCPVMANPGSSGGSRATTEEQPMPHMNMQELLESDPQAFM